MRIAAATTAGLALLTTAAQDDGFTDKQVRAIAAGYATCVIKSSAGRARRFVVGEDAPPPIIGSCLNQAARMSGGEMRFPAAMYRYAMAEALVVRDYPAGVPDGIAEAPAIERPPLDPLDEAKLPKSAKRAAEARERHARGEGFRVLDIVTDCVVRREPAAAYALVRAPLDTPAETAAFGRLKTAIGQCLPQGETVRMNRSVLRGSVAANLYRLSHAVRPVTA